jgi:hypothetical protein
MKYTARLIYKSVNTCFHTTLPVYFYGLPNGSILVLYASCKNGFPDDTSLKWILAEHLDFSYDFATGIILTAGSREIEICEFMELADNLEQRIITKATYGNFANNSEAMHFLSVTLHNLLNNHKQKQMEPDYY